MKKNQEITFDLKSAFLDLQQEMIQHLLTGRKHISHSGAKGIASELKWRDTLKGYLPQRYHIDKAFVIDSKGNQSDEIDIVINI